MRSPITLREGAIPLAAGLLAIVGLMAAGCHQARAAEFSGSAALTTDYVFRGISQTQGDPAAQAGFKVASASGVYGALWGSNVEYTGDIGASSEIDSIVGWSGTFNDDWALDVNITWFDYPAARVDLSYAELIGTVTYRDTTWLMVGYSPDMFATDEAGVYAQLGHKLPISDTVRLEGAIAHYALDDAYGDSYSHAQLGAVWAFKAPFEARLTAHATDSNAEDIFGDTVAGTRIEAALQASF